MGNVAFFLNSYNDIDNIAPVIWKFLEKGECPIVIFGTKYDYKNDYRLVYFQEKFSLKIIDFPSEYKIFSVNTILRKIKYIIGSYSTYKKILCSYGVTTCVFEWNVSFGSNLQNMFLGAATNHKIPTIAIPHGVSIYTNYAVAKHEKEYYEKTGRYRCLPAISYVNLHVDPNIETQILHQYSGVDPNICEVWGSARYDPKWAKINLKLCPKFNAIKSTDGKIKVILMLPHWEYNVDVVETISLIDMLANSPWIYLAIKDHTRGNGGLDDDLRTKLNSLPNVEASVSAQSPALIQWSDVVVNFGSSIGIEAILQDKILINPSYLHTNHTLFEKTNSAFEPQNNVELIDILKKVKDDKLNQISLESKKLLLKEAVYAGKDEYDILELYWKNISTIKSRLNYESNRSTPHIVKVYRMFIIRLKLKLPTIQMLMKGNPIISFKYVMKWILHTHFDK